MMTRRKANLVQVLVAFLFCVTYVSTIKASDDISRHKVYRMFEKSLATPTDDSSSRIKVSKRDTKDEDIKNSRIGDRTVFAKFNFYECGETTNHTVYVKNMAITPNPLEIPGNVTIHVTVHFSEVIDAPLAVQLEMQKKLPILFGETSWFKIPCFNNGFGSCLHDDLCDVRMFKESGCIDNDTGNTQPCSCPFKSGTYTFAPTTYKIPPLPPNLPSYLLEGDFIVKAILLKDEIQVGCYEGSVEMDV